MATANKKLFLDLALEENSKGSTSKTFNVVHRENIVKTFNEKIGLKYKFL